MCITVGGAKRNLRIGISQPDTKIKGRQPFAEGFLPMVVLVGDGLFQFLKLFA
ncbi:MAG: hypothetical protein LBU34_07560 [Planctomycetaceae bacterium]|nr:hypothetical protein [Planctomycetaceae bacterium]